jgi:hypothetical protein
MIRKWLLAFLGCFCLASAANAGNCRGRACVYTTFGEDAKGCLEIRNSGREDIEVMVYTTGSVPTTVRIAAGNTEKVFKTGRVCILAAHYMRSEAQFSGGPFAPSR